MNNQTILDAIGMIDDHYILSAQKQLGCIPSQEASLSTVVPVKRIRSKAVIGIAAAMMLLLSSFVTAMAVNEEFREMVFEFFHITAVENVPNGNDSADKTHVDLGVGVSAEYINVGKELTSSGNGILYNINYSENGEISDVSFYQLTGGIVQDIQTNRTEFHVSAGGTSVDGYAYWCLSDDRFAAIGRGQTTDRSKMWEISTISGQSEMVLLSIYSGIEDNLAFYAFWLDLHTGAAEAVFEDDGLCELTHVQEFQVAPNCKYALIRGQSDYDLTDAPYVYNLEYGNLLQLLDMTGTENIDKVLWADDDTALLTLKKDNHYICWAYHIQESTMEKTVDEPLLNSDVDGSGGVVDLNGRYLLHVDETGVVAVIDQKDGTRSAAIYGFVYDKRGQILLGADGEKACYFVSAQSSDSLSVETLGVIDFTAAKFTIFDRSGFDQNQELRLGWLDKNSVAISTAGNGADLYVYKFE